MRLLGLDLGNKTGWALYDDGIVHHGVWDLAPTSQSRFEGGGMRFVRFVDKLRQLPPPDRIAFEEVRSHRRKGQRSQNVTAAQIYGGYLAKLTSWAEVEGIPHEAYPIGVIKKRATGKGNCGKPEVVAAASALLGESISDDNEADAIWAMVLGLESAGISLDF